MSETPKQPAVSSAAQQTKQPSKQPSRFELLRYYSDSAVNEQMIKAATGREVVGTHDDGSYTKRPNMVQYPNDITQMVKLGAVSFHGSVEHWSNPMMLDASDASRKLRDSIRNGWDFVVDLDAKHDIAEAKTAARVVCDFLESYGIKNYGLKFSGRRGFHIILPWQMFPKEINYEPLAKKYPDYPKALAGFMRERIAEKLMDALLREQNIRQLIELLEEKPEEISPYFFVEIEKDWGDRHLFRLPYSLNEKTWLVSAPLERSELASFKPESASISEVLKRTKGGAAKFIKECKPNEALALLTDALDWFASQPKLEKKQIAKRIEWDKKINEEMFPPCIRKALAGLEDGRKRTLFTLVNFLRIMNWSWDEISERLWTWNAANFQPLPENLVLTQLRWNQQQVSSRGNIIPANCEGDGKKHGSTFYSFLCEPDELCRGIKNPVSYPFRKMKKLGLMKPKKFVGKKGKRAEKKRDEKVIGRVIKPGFIKK